MAWQVTVRDFTMVFDAYTQFEESVLTAKIRMAEVCVRPSSLSTDPRVHNVFFLSFEKTSRHCCRVLVISLVLVRRHTPISRLGPF